MRGCEVPGRARLRLSRSFQCTVRSTIRLSRSFVLSKPKRQTETPRCGSRKDGDLRGVAFGKLRDAPSPCRNGGHLKTGESSELASCRRRLEGGERVQHGGLVGCRVHPGLIHSTVVRSWHSIRSICPITAASRAAGAGWVAVGSAVSTAAGLATAASVTAVRHPEQGPQTAAAGAASREQNHNGESDETLHDRAFRDRECVNRDQSGLRIAMEGESVVGGKFDEVQDGPGSRHTEWCVRGESGPQRVLPSQ